MYINYLNQDLRVSTDMHEEPKDMNLRKEVLGAINTKTYFFRK